MTLAEIFREEGFKEGFEEGFKKGFKEGFEEEIKKGIEKGRMEYKKEAAEKLIAKGFSFDEAVELVGLSIKEIKY